jgi:outer membrane protein OmpA-like peptidoglycan-associated protein
MIYRPVVVLIMLLFVANCAGPTNENRQTKHGVLIGAGTGAILGNVIGRDTEGTLVGAALGAVVGGAIGNRVGAYMDKQEAALRRAVAASETASIERVNNALIATFKSDIMFDFNSALIKPGGLGEVKRVAGVLNQFADTTIRIEGHTDTTGPEQYNQILSQRRADAVKNALIKHAVSASRMQAIGYGESMPIGSNAQNRRVSIVITPVAGG